MLKLTILKDSYKKIQCFLTNFPNSEWSGPAWYKYKKNKIGFPGSWTLVYFEPIHLGSSGSTEFSGSKLNKILLANRENPELKGCLVGLIHSHHSMKAYFSETDLQQMKENANDRGYPSLVVSSTSNYTFGISYFDQYKIPHIVKGDKIVTNIDINPLWKETIKSLKKMKKEEIEEKQTRYTGHYTENPIGQRKLWETNKWKNKKQDSFLEKDYHIERGREVDGWGNAIDEDYYE
tara:strand:+ start:1080 stop:1784 length:705 start_codon:yes stop_codon:yes gene_type:complete